MYQLQGTGQAVNVGTSEADRVWAQTVKQRLHRRVQRMVPKIPSALKPAVRDGAVADHLAITSRPTPLPRGKGLRREYN